MTLLFAPGAGAPSTSAWMTAWAERLRAFGTVVSFDYPYGREGKKRPDPHATLVAAHIASVDAITDKPLVLVGKSMGSRIGCHVSLERSVAALVCFGYPLRGANGKLRDEVLLALKTPILFIQGTRDALGPLDTLADVRSRMQAPSSLHIVEGGDHSLMLTPGVRKRDPQAQARADAAIVEAVQRHLADYAAT